MLEDDIQHPECPEFVLLNREDVLLLLKIIKQAEYLEAQLTHFDSLGFTSAKKVLERWRRFYFSEV
jgi:hypothetical protein